MALVPGWREFGLRREVVYLASVAKLALMGFCALANGEILGSVQYHAQIQPILKTYCYDCHAGGVDKGDVSFDKFICDEQILTNRDLWLTTLDYVRAGLMPPPKKPHPTADQRAMIADWIKRCVFHSDPQNPDPGRVVLRRLNRAEYRSTMRDLMGTDFDTEFNFPPDDTGFGFDTISGVLTLAPMLLEKYFAAAEAIVARTVPLALLVPREIHLPGRHFRGVGADATFLSYYSAAVVSSVFDAPASGSYKLTLDVGISDKLVGDGPDDVSDDDLYCDHCRLRLKIDGSDVLCEDYGPKRSRPCHYEIERDWATGSHQLEFEVTPLSSGSENAHTLSLQITNVSVRGPMEQEHWVKPKNYDRFFSSLQGIDKADRRGCATKVLSEFAYKAFRRPPGDQTVRRLAGLAEEIYSQPGKTFEEGVAHAMVAVLSSPRFLFREEAAEAGRVDEAYPFIDEYSLASRLSYFLWSSMPDSELLGLAAEGSLRQNLDKEVRRMLTDRRAQGLVRDFTGQWLRARDVEGIPIAAEKVLARERKPDLQVARNRKRFRELNAKPHESLTSGDQAELKSLREFLRTRPKVVGTGGLNRDVRRAMRQETERVVAYVLLEDRCLLELLESDYTFLNERLAQFYGIGGVVGPQMRRVTLPPDSVRGGVLTEGTVLVGTSNPSRTSPVKRGLFILDSILGTPPRPPPPDIPPLEIAAKGVTNHTPSLRETLALHRQTPQCASCHARMDPLGLALENFNALGLWRTNEFGDPIESTGQLITGEAFQGVRDLKHILVQKHADDLYRTLTTKMLTYAIGRGLEYYDEESVDQIVARIQKSGGRASALICGIIQSAPFQKTRVPAGPVSASLISAQTLTPTHDP